MASTITIDNLDDGQELEFFPYEVTGNAVPVGAGVQVIAMAWQIDDQELNDLTPFDPFSFSVGTVQCPNVDTWHLLTIYAWDDAGVLTTANRTFKRIAELGTATDDDDTHTGNG